MSSVDTSKLRYRPTKIKQHRSERRTIIIRTLCPPFWCSTPPRLNVSISVKSANLFFDFSRYYIMTDRWMKMGPKMRDEIGPLRTRPRNRLKVRFRHLWRHRSSFLSNSYKMTYKMTLLAIRIMTSLEHIVTRICQNRSLSIFHYS